MEIGTGHFQVVQFPDHFGQLGAEQVRVGVGRQLYRFFQFQPVLTPNPDQVNFRIAGLYIIKNRSKQFGFPFVGSAAKTSAVVR